MTKIMNGAPLKQDAPNDAQQESPRDLDWTGPNDPDCPYNWPMRKRLYMTSIPVLLCISMSFASSVYTSEADDISQHYNVPRIVSLLGLSLFLWGLGLGAIIAAAISEYYGRRIVYLTTIPVFGLFILGSGLTPNFAALAIFRFFAGFFGSAVVSVGGGTNADIRQPALAGFIYPFYFVSPFLGPALGPVIGGFITKAKGFRWLEWVILFMIAFNYLYCLPQSEYYKKTILQKRASTVFIRPQVGSHVVYSSDWDDRGPG